LSKNQLSGPLISVHPGEFLSICRPVYELKLVRDPNSQASGPLSERFVRRPGRL